MELHVLPSDVVSRIAAGEVVERPASIVKELVENALDAGALKIDVECRRGGVELIVVADDGCGIPSPLVPLAFARHATSKIASFDDLVHVGTLGFRGEALPSIAAVADVEVSSRSGDEDLGSYVYLHGGYIAQQESKPRSRGTTIAVRRLFRQLPARLKFLKSEGTENSHCAQIVTQYALANPLVAFSLMLEDRVTLRTSGSGDLRDVMAQLYGTAVARALVEARYSSDTVTVTGLVAPASLSRAGRGHQSTFVNRRWVRSPLLQRAIEEGYRGLLPDGRNAIAVLNIDMPPELVDVNVHPSKAQVKFADEHLLFRSVKDAVATALSRTHIASEAEHVTFPSGPAQQSRWSVAESAPAEEFTPAAQGTPGSGSPLLPPLRILGQILATYIVAEGPDGLYLIDQHAAHERIVYDRLVEQQQRGEPETQGLLEPVSIEFTPTESAILSGLLDTLAGLGLSLESFGGHSYLLRTVPAAMDIVDIAGQVREIVNDLSQGPRHDIQGRALETVACHAAVRAGKQLTHDEMRGLVRQLEQTAQPRTCPHGRPTILHLAQVQLEKLFSRRT